MFHSMFERTCGEEDYHGISIRPDTNSRGTPNSALRLQTSRLNLFLTPSLISVVQKRTAHSSPGSYSSRWQENKDRIVTWTAVAICCATFVYQGWARQQASRYQNMKPWRFVEENLVCNANNFQAGRWWTLITHSFMHFTPVHLGFNALGLISLAQPIVTYFGTTAFVVCWLGSALSAGVATLWWQNHISKSGKMRSGAVGASGPLFGLTAMLACLAPRLPVSLMFLPISFPIVGALAATVGFSLASMNQGWLPWMGHAGHLGGISFGLLYYALILRGKRMPRF